MAKVLNEQKTKEAIELEQLTVAERKLKEAEAALEIKDKLIRSQAETLQEMAKALEVEKNTNIMKEIAQTPEAWKNEKQEMLRHIRNLELNNIYWQSTAQAIKGLCK